MPPTVSVEGRRVSTERPAGPITLARGVAMHVLVAVAAVAVAIMAAWVSRAMWRPGQLSVPWGMTLGVAGSASAMWLARATAPSLGFAAAAGWIAGLTVLLAGGRGGDLLVIADTQGYAFLLLATGAVIVTVGWGSWKR